MLGFPAIALVVAFTSVTAQFPPKPEGLTVLKSKLHENVSVSYKETKICETTPGVKSFSGYISLPSSIFDSRSPEYTINTFFWFFESRKRPESAPLGVWFGGGPGYSSVQSALGENGPCSVNPDSNSTTLNPLSWNNEVNMLYIDQPNMVGYSYDTLVNGTIDQALRQDPAIETRDFAKFGVPTTNATFFVGTFPSQDAKHTANSTGNAAPIVWHLLQTLFDEFPTYSNSRVSIWTESYGGRWGPAFSAYLQEQNAKIASNTSATTGAIKIHLDTLGLINAYIDPLLQVPQYPEMAYNNTYDLKTISKSVYETIRANLTQPGGCIDQILHCQALQSSLDPEDLANNSNLNSICAEAYGFCATNVQVPYGQTSGRSKFDIAHFDPDSFPPTNYALGYLNQHWVQAALGAPVNYTSTSIKVLDNFVGTGDLARSGHLQDITQLLDDGVKVALIYGDRDYQVNWLGGEAVSLAVNYSHAAAFHSAGYQPINANPSYIGGLVRQHGNFSFSRVFQAGHQVPYYQPETAYRIFMRSMFGTDVATGKVSVSGNYSTVGPASSFAVKNQVPASPPPICHTMAVHSSCTEEQRDWLIAGTAIVKDFVVVGNSAAMTK